MFLALIVGGGEATPHSIPHQAVLVLKGTNNAKCGGSILSENFVLTAAHCFDPGHFPGPFTLNTYQIVVGEHDLKNNSDTATRHNFANVYRHPRFK